jgi:hypothetical protein
MLILDAGAFVAAERGNREVIARVKRERQRGHAPLTNGAVVSQAGAEVAPVDDLLGKRAGMLLARAGAADAIDASVVCLAQDGDDILTSDPGDLLDLVWAAGVHVELIPV